MTEKKITDSLPAAEADEIPPEKKKNGALRILIILIVFLAGSATALYFLPQIEGRLPVLAEWLGTSGDQIIPDTALTERVSALENWLNRQEEDLQALKSARDMLVESDPQLLGRIEKLEQAGTLPVQDMSRSARIDMLLSRMAQLEASFIPLSKGLSDAQAARQERAVLTEKSTSQGEKLGLIEKRLTQVEQYAARDNSGALLAYRISSLRQKVLSGEAFGAEIAAVKNMVAKGSLASNQKLDAALTWLSAQKDGIATGHQLSDQFDKLIPNMLRARSSQKDDPWWKRTYDSAKSLIMVRRTNKDNADDFEALLSETQQKLERFDLDETLALLKSLPENIREILDMWMLQAEIYLRARQELDRIESLTAVNAIMPQSGADEETSL